MHWVHARAGESRSHIPILGGEGCLVSLSNFGFSTARRYRQQGGWAVHGGWR